MGIVAAPVLVPAALTLALILAASPPAHAPGIPQVGPLPPSRDELRLRELVAKHDTGQLSAGEEVELIALLASVKGIRVQKLSELRTPPSRTPDPNAQPKGRVTKINPKNDKVTQKGLARENESAIILSQSGYDVEQNPSVGHTDKNPDYLIEGKIFDCYAPNNANPRAIASNIKAKVNSGQTQRIILNLDDSGVDVEALRQQFTQYPVAGLNEVIIIKNGQILHFIP